MCYVFREGYDGAPIDLDKLRGLTLEPNEKAHHSVQRDRDDVVYWYLIQ